MPKYLIEHIVSSGKNGVKTKTTPITRMDDAAAKKTYLEFCQNANTEGKGPSVHPAGLFRLERGKKIKIETE